MKSYLVLIGNGFDLECGMKTTYKDFFQWQENCLDIKLFDNQWEKVLPKIVEKYNTLKIETNKLTINSEDKYITVWDLYFLLELKTNDQTWGNIENLIYRSFLKKPDVSYWEKIYEIARNPFHKTQDFEKFMQCFNEQKSINENQIILSYYIKHSTDKIYDKVQPGKLLEYLQNQLRLFEIKFCKYIDLVCKNCSGASFFNDEIKNLIRFIIGNENDEDLKSGKDSLYILSFNYSYYPYLAIGVEDKSVNIVKNDKIFIVINNSFWVSIHGDCRDLNIIIGIDDHQLKNESHKLWENAKFFSKTYRAMSMTPNSATPKTSNRELKTFYLPSINNDVEICFYGLSLNQNDYSYYQALFDRYDIYNNKKIKIVFATKKEYEFELKDSVYELLKNYGKTLDNKDHGKNLITLLLLEKRLMFRIK